MRSLAHVSTFDGMSERYDNHGLDCLLGRDLLIKAQLWRRSSMNASELLLAGN